jgi:hypothetical protein
MLLNALATAREDTERYELFRLTARAQRLLTIAARLCDGLSTNVAALPQHITLAHQRFNEAFTLWQV